MENLLQDHRLARLQKALPTYSVLDRVAKIRYVVFAYVEFSLVHKFYASYPSSFQYMQVYIL